MELTADLLAALADYQPYIRGSGILLRGSRKNGKLTNQVMSVRAIGGRVNILGRDILGLWDLSPMICAQLGPHLGYTCGEGEQSFCAARCRRLDQYADARPLRGTGAGG